MDPVSAFGLISGGVQVLQAIASTVHGLNQLVGKFRDADLTIQSLIQELRCISTALTSLNDWTRSNSADGLQSEEYIRDLAVAMDGCRVIMDVVSHDVSTLVQGTRVENGIAGFRTRIRVVWNEDTMRGHHEKLQAQVMALQLLLQVCQCHTSTEQLRLLRAATTRRIFHRVKDDTATILSSRGSCATSYAGSISHNGRLSITSRDPDFDSHRAEADMPMFHTVMDSTVPNATSIDDDQPQPLIPDSDYSPFTFTDDGFSSSHTENTSLTVPSLNVPASKFELDDYFPLPSSPSGPVRHPTNPSHSRSVSHSQTNHQPAPEIRRNASDSKAQRLRTSGSKREKLSSFLRLNTRSRANLAVSPGSSPSLSTSPGSLKRRQRLETDLTTSIDVTPKNAASVPQIIKAAQAGSRDEVERLIDQGCDIEARHSRSNKNALLVAAHCGREDVVDLLLQNNAKLNVIDRGGWTALHFSASRGHRGVLEILLEEGGDLLETPNSYGQTALRVAADFGQLETTFMLLSHHAQVNARAENQMTALHAAAKRGDDEISQMLISHGADLEAKDGDMMTALHLACEQGHIETIKLLLENRAVIDATGREHKTPLICAAEAGRSQAVKLLLERKANSRSLDETGMTALHWAAYNGREETVRVLSEKKGSLDTVNYMGRTALHLATMQSQYAVVDFLQRKGMPLNARCKAGLTALHYACMADSDDSFKITRLLLMTGADVEASEPQHQQRPLHIAAARGSVPILELLCDRGAILDARNGAGDRPACVASRFGHVGVVQKLLDRGSPLYLKFDTGFREDSLLCLAAVGGHWAVTSLLLARGASIVKKDEAGWPPIRYAVYHGHIDILKLFLSSNKIPSSEMPEIIQLPTTIGFASGVSRDRAVEIQQLLGKTSLPYPSTMVSKTGLAALRQNPVLDGRSMPVHQATIPSYVPVPTQQQQQEQEQSYNTAPGTHISSVPPGAIEAGGSTVYELSGSIDQEPRNDTQRDTSTGTREQSTTMLGRRATTPEMKQPEPTQPLSGDRIAALLRDTSTHDPVPSSLLTSTSASTSASANASGPGPGPGTSVSNQHRNEWTPQVSATFTPVSLIYNPTPSPPVRSHVPHPGRQSVLITPPPPPPPLPLGTESSVGTSRVPRTVPVYAHTSTSTTSVSRAGSRSRGRGRGKNLEGADSDSDSDSDSISSVYTAPEGGESESVVDRPELATTTSGISSTVRGNT